MVVVSFCVKKKCTIVAPGACHSSPWEKCLLMSRGVLSTGSQCYSEGLLAQNEWGTQDSCQQSKSTLDLLEEKTTWSLRCLLSTPKKAL